MSVTTKFEKRRKSTLYNDRNVPMQLAGSSLMLSAPIITLGGIQYVSDQAKKNASKSVEELNSILDLAEETTDDFDRYLFEQGAISRPQYEAIVLRKQKLIEDKLKNYDVKLKALAENSYRKGKINLLLPGMAGLTALLGGAALTSYAHNRNRKNFNLAGQ